MGQRERVNPGSGTRDRETVLMVKVAAGCLGFSMIGLFLIGLIIAAMVGTAHEWCSLPCGSFQSCDSPYGGDEVCDEILRAAIEDDREAPEVWINWIQTESGTWVDLFGREVSGLQRGANEISSAYVPGRAICTTSLRHEVRHVLIRKDRDPEGDPNHEIEGWSAFDGC